MLIRCNESAVTKQESSQSCGCLQLYAALAEAPTVPLSELAAPQHAMATSLAQLFAALATVGTPFQLPEGVSLQTIDAGYARQVLAAVAPAVPHKADHPVATVYSDADTAIAALEVESCALRTRMHAAIAAACAAWRALPERVTVLVRPLMAGLRRLPETCMHAEVIAPALAELTAVCASREPCPNGKIVSHLVSMATSDAGAASAGPSQLTDSAASTYTRSVSLEASVPGGASGALMSLQGSTLHARSGGAEATSERSGARCALQAMCIRADGSLPELYPQLWQLALGPIAAMAQDVDARSDGAVAADAVSGAQVLLCTASHLHAAMHAQLQQRLAIITKCMAVGGASVSDALAAALGGLADAQPACWLEPLGLIVPELMDRAESDGRRGAGAALLSCLLDRSPTLTLRLVPLAPLLAAPALALMSDPVAAVRSRAAAAFGRLVTVLPLAAGAPPPASAALQDALAKQRAADGGLLEQLTAPGGVVEYEPPVQPSGVTLRAYQREGISWLAFLKRAGLHGILADDMGLGKVRSGATCRRRVCIASRCGSPCGSTTRRTRRLHRTC